MLPCAPIELDARFNLHGSAPLGQVPWPYIHLCMYVASIYVSMGTTDGRQGVCIRICKRLVVPNNSQTHGLAACWIASVVINEPPVS